MSLKLADMLGAEFLGRAVEVLGELPDCADIDSLWSSESNCGAGVPPAPCFVIGSQDLLVTRTLSCRRPGEQHTAASAAPAALFKRDSVPLTCRAGKRIAGAAIATTTRDNQLHLFRQPRQPTTRQPGTVTNYPFPGSRHLRRLWPARPAHICLACLCSAEDRFSLRLSPITFRTRGPGIVRL